MPKINKFTRGFEHDPLNNYNYHGSRYSMEDTYAMPGQKIASIEEYESGRNTFDDGDMVRSTVVGTINIDKNERVAAVKKAQQKLMPEAGDIVIGTVAAVMSTMIAVSIDFINGAPSKSGVECICSTRNIRKRTIALANDIVTLKILSQNNGTLHATINEPNLGVLFTKCRKCGDKVLPYRDAIKCKECSWIDDRKLSNDFGKAAFMS